MDTASESPTLTVSKADLAEPEDLYKRYKTLQKQLEFLETQEDYLKDEMKVGLSYLPVLIFGTSLVSPFSRT